MSVDTDVVDTVDRVADHRLRKKREAGSIGYPRGVIHVLAQLSPLQPAAKLRAEVCRSDKRLGAVRKRCGDHPVDPTRTLVLEKVSEWLIEHTSYQLGIVVEENLRGRDRHIE